MKILARMPNWLGDAILALPALRSLAKNFPRAELWVAATDRTVELFASESEVAGVIEIPGAMDLKQLWRTARRLRTWRFDLALLFTNSFGSALLLALAGIPERWGYATDGRGALLTRRVPSWAGEKKRLSQGGAEASELAEENESSFEEKSEHQAFYYLRLLRGLDLEVPDEVEITLRVNQAEKEAGRKVLEAAGIDLGRLREHHLPLVLLGPGASYGPAKRWPAERFGSVAVSLEKHWGATCAIVGSVEEVNLAREVAGAALEKGARRPAAILAGQTTLRELLGIISHASLLITNDSGPMHLANALRVPVVAIFGPTNPRVTRPFHDPAIVLHKKVICWPCWYRECPYDHRCMRKVSEGEVMAACSSLLARAGYEEIAGR